MNEEEIKGNGFKESFSIPKQSANSLFDVLTISKIKYENIDVFLANLKIPNLPQEKIKKSIGPYIYYFEVTRNKNIWQ